MRRKYPLIRKTVAPIPSAALDAIARGPRDEQAHALGEAVPSVQEMMDAPVFDEVMQKASAPRTGVAMAQVNLGGDGHETAPLYRPVGLGFQECRQFVDQFTPAGLIVNRRIRQVQRFIAHPRYDYLPGFKLRFAEEGRQVRDEDKAMFAWLRKFLSSGGAEFDPRLRRALQRDSLMDFTAKHLRDSLTADHAPIELIPTPSGRIHGFQAVDMERVYLTDPNTGLDGEYSGPPEFNMLTQRRSSFGDPKSVIAVYEQDGAIKAHYTHEDMLLPVRNVTSDQRHYGYGMAEPDRVLRIGTAFLDAMTLNARSISDNSIPRGVLNLVGDYDQKDIAKLRATLSGQGRGPANRFRLLTISTPAGEGNGANIMPIGGQIEEALYSRWITLLVAITCGVWLMDPTEIGFESYTASGTSNMSGSDTEARLTSSQDAGLYSLLSWYGNSLNEVLHTVAPGVELYWTGLDEDKADAAAREANLMTFREARELHGMSCDNMDDRLLDAPLNPALMGAYMQTMPQPDPPPGPIPGELPGGPQEGADAPGGSGGPAEDAPDQDDPSGAAQGPDFATTPQDPEHPTGPAGERRFQDGQGGVWQHLVKAQGAGQYWPEIDLSFGDAGA